MSKKWVLLFIGLIGLLMMGACTSGEPDAGSDPDPGPTTEDTDEPTGPGTEPEATAEPGTGEPAADEPVFGGQFETHTRGEPRGGFEPHMPGGLREKRMLLGMYLEHPVVKMDSTEDKCNEIMQPWLLESWGYADELTFELNIRQGVTWQDLEPLNGRPMTAEDVRFSIQRLLDRGVLEAVDQVTESIEVVDEDTVHMNLSEPYPGLDIQLLGQSEVVVLAEELLNEEGTVDRFHAVGTGPFIMDDYDPAAGAMLSRNPNYWNQPKPYVDTVQVRFMADKGTRLAAFEAGQLDMMDELSPSEVNRAKNTQPEGQYFPCVLSLGMLWFNHSQEPFNDVRVRRAVSMAINREGIVEAVYRGEGVIPGIAFPSETEWATPYDELDPEVKQWYEYNPERARELLDEAGVPEGFMVELWAPNHLGVPMNPVIESLPRMLSEVGLEVELNSVAIAQYNDTIQKGEFNHLAISKNPLGWERLEGALYKHWSENPPSINRSHYNDPEFDTLLTNALNSLDPEEMQDWAKQAERYFMMDAGMLELPGPYYYVAYQPWVGGELLAGGRSYRNQHGITIAGLWLYEKE